MRKLFTTIAALSFAGMASFANAQDSQPTAGSQANDLDALLELVRQGKTAETEANRQREQRFAAARDNQARLLQEANDERTQQERLAAEYEQRFQDNETEIANEQDRLNKRLGTLSELFGVLQQVAGDTRSVFAGSLISAQYPDRSAPLSALIEKASGGSDLPSIEEMEGLWAAMQGEMTESGKISSFTTTVTTPDGGKETVELTRVGDFSIIGNGKYYNYDVANGEVTELGRQPDARFTSSVENYLSASSGEIVTLGMDPSRGQLMSMLIQAPSLKERVDQGGEVGYLILALGAIGMFFAVIHALYLIVKSGQVKAQIKNDTPNLNNPLGRVLQVYQDNKNVDVETLELKLDEAILKETPALERFLNMIKLISAVAPLFGLLGTVIGMIATFQSITLFGTGDPKLMANGISQALVTTVEGLVVAIPTLLAHSFVAGMSKNVIHILEEQSAGIIAAHAEKEAANG